MNMPVTYGMLLESVGVDCMQPHLAWSRDVPLMRLEQGELIDMVPRPYQIKALYHAIWNARWGIFDEPGCGKTLPAQAVALYRACCGDKTLIVMPPRLLDQFAQSLQLTFPNHPVTVKMLRAAPTKREAMRSTWNTHGWPQILMMSYEVFTKLTRPPSVKRTKKKATGAIEIKKSDAGEWTADILREYSYLVTDEAHKIKNWSTLVHMAVEQFVERPEAGFLPMTGTPIPNQVLDAYGLIRLLNSKAYYNHKQFESAHCIYGEGAKGYSHIVGYRGLETVTENLYKFASRTLKRDAMPWLPKTQIIEVPVALEKWHQRLYKEMVEQRVLEVGGEVLDFTSQQRLRMACLQCVTTPEKFTDTPKENAVLEVIDEIMDDIGFDMPEVDDFGVPVDPRPGQKSRRKIIIFAHFRDSVDAIALRYKKYGAVKIYGGSTQKEAKEAERRFKEDPNCRVLVANPRSGGVGLNLQDWCSTVIFAEPTSVPGEFQQAVDRADRSGQIESVTVYIIKALKTSALTLIRNMRRKAEDVVYVNRDGSTLLRDLLGDVDEYEYRAASLEVAA